MAHNMLARWVPKQPSQKVARRREPVEIFRRSRGSGERERQGFQKNLYFVYQTPLLVSWSVNLSLAVSDERLFSPVRMRICDAHMTPALITWVPVRRKGVHFSCHCKLLLPKSSNPLFSFLSLSQARASALLVHPGHIACPSIPAFCHSITACPCSPLIQVPLKAETALQ